jgi:hypothetical protein
MSGNYVPYALLANTLHSFPISNASGWEPHLNLTTPEQENSFNQTFNKTDPPNKPCEELGFSLRRTSPRDRANRSCSVLPETLLQRMVTCYPRGRIFNLDDVVVTLNDQEKSMSPDHDDEREIATKLAGYFPQAKSVLFCPLWDWNKSRWLAGTFAWTGAYERALQLEELHYFKAFGATIMSEIAQLDWLTSEKSKSDFISSVSHELRSPLHGILASIELLDTAKLSSAHYDLIKMVETCALTLLDTVNHMYASKTTSCGRSLC